MIVLALELSSIQGSLALTRDGKLLVEKVWNERNIRGQELFRSLPDLLAGSGAKLADVDVFAAGRGPGAYSGLRVAITSAQAFALPSSKPVYTVSSGEALALEVAEQENADDVAIVGDARRDTLWYGLFRRQVDSVECVHGWTVIDPPTLPSALPADCVVAVADWLRLEEKLSALDLRQARLIREPRYPRASFVARIAERRIAGGETSDPLTPIYMHPAVAGKPRAAPAD